MLNQCQRDNELEKMGGTSASGVTVTAEIPNIYNKMNAKLPKAPFRDRAMNEHFHHIGKYLRCTSYFYLLGIVIDMKHILDINTEKMSTVKEKI